MKNKATVSGFSLRVIGIIITFCSIIPVPFARIEEYLISRSANCYDHHKFTIPPNSDYYIPILEDEIEHALTIRMPTTINLSFRVQPGNIDLYIEYKQVFWVLAHIHDRFFAWELKVSDKPWVKAQAFYNISSLNRSVSSPKERFWRLRFESNNLNASTSVDLSVKLHYTINGYKDVTTLTPLLPFKLVYVGVSTSLIGAVVLVVERRKVSSATRS